MNNEGQEKNSNQDIGTIIVDQEGEKSMSN